jgi:hypothetical protein
LRNETHQSGANPTGGSERLPVEDIDPETVELIKINDHLIDGPLAAYQSDVQGDVLMVKFSRPGLIETLDVAEVNGWVTLTIQGDLDGATFSAEDTIKVIP